MRYYHCFCYCNNWDELFKSLKKQFQFLVEDNEVHHLENLSVEDYSADYWVKRYTVRRERIPKFLERVDDIILRTGKYLNVIRQCGEFINICHL